MKNFKKYIAAMLIFILALSLCSCSLIDRLKPAPAPETVRLTFPEARLSFRRRRSSKREEYAQRTSSSRQSTTPRGITNSLKL